MNRPAPQFDILALGEVMLRLDPGPGRTRTTRQFAVSEGGGEYNVARGLRRCFGQRAGIVTALTDNEVGRLVEDLILQGGVSTEFIDWAPFDGIGEASRNGLNFTERGFGVRGAVGVSDRAHTAVSQMSAGQIDWNRILDTVGTRWLHTGGIFAALGPATADVAHEAVALAGERAIGTSFDLNYRPSLWKRNGGPAAAKRVNDEIASQVRVLIGNEEDYTSALGFPAAARPDYTGLDVGRYGELLASVMTRYPNVQLCAVTLREVHSASSNTWSALAFDGTNLAVSRRYEHLEIFDRVGGGDSFASGLIYGLMEGLDLSLCVEVGAAHGALAMTTPGDTSMVTAKEVMHLATGGGARVQR
jgi:2-dehydro-3-deoxygluconokinase